MKKWFALFIAALLIFSVAAAETQITVNGSGECQAEADVAIVVLGVSAREKDVADAQEKVNGTILAIRSALEEAGIPGEQINTDHISIYPVYDYTDGVEKISGYSASSMLAIRLTRIDRAGEVIDLCLSYGANTLNGINFSATDTQDAAARALCAAVEDAKKKAQILAGAAGLKLTGIVKISDSGTYSATAGVESFDRVMAKEEAAGSTSVQAAKLTVYGNVVIVFSAE